VNGCDFLDRQECLSHNVKKFRLLLSFVIAFFDVLLAKQRKFGFGRRRKARAAGLNPAGEVGFDPADKPVADIYRRWNAALFDEEHDRRFVCLEECTEFVESQ
jgi:hypothetical protein